MHAALKPNNDKPMHANDLDTNKLSRCRKSNMGANVFIRAMPHAKAAKLTHI